MADQGIYVASESSFYRVLRDADQLAHRGKAKAPSRKRPEPLEATGANQLWSWDITYLKTTVKGLFFYLYMIMDVYSRKIVGWEVCETESAEHASVLFRKTYLREGIAGRVLFLHSDNGSPMKGATMLATLEKLGVMAGLRLATTIRIPNRCLKHSSTIRAFRRNPLIPSKRLASGWPGSSTGTMRFTATVHSNS